MSVRVIYPMTLSPEEVRAVALDAVERADKPLGAPETSAALLDAMAAERLRGRREGLLEAVALLRGAAGRMAGGGTLHVAWNALRLAADELEAAVARAGEP